MLRPILTICFMGSLVAAPALVKADTDYLNLGKSALEAVQGSSKGSLGSGLSEGEIATGLKDALKIGAKKAVATVGKSGGFLNDKDVHIPLPGPLAKVKSGLAMIGQSGMADDLENRINKAAETAAPKAANILGDAVSRMSIDDARGILTGPPDAATQYFKRSATPDLKAAMKPIVDKSLANVGALKSYNALNDQVKTMPFSDKVNLDLNSYVVDKTLGGIFFYLAKQEADIRANPAARTTDVLKAVFK